VGSIERDGDVIVVRLDTEERIPLASLAAAAIEMLEPPDSAGAGSDPDPDPLEAMVGLGGDGPVEIPDDRALRRLLPDAYADPGEAAEFRRLTDTALRAEKAANLRRILDAVATPGGVVRIGPDDVDAWLAGLNDIRLMLGERLDITEELDLEQLEQLQRGDPKLPLFAAYFLLSEMQELMLQFLMAD
jgi:hypothetical protein